MKASRLAVAGVLAAGAILAAAAPAAARPAAPAATLPGCSIHRIQTGPFTEGAELRCPISRSWKVRVVIQCHELLSGADYTTYGPWVTIPGVSSASCTPGRFLTDYHGEAIA
ncbi:hypothetical protein ACTMTJ_20615 [Phytohabitans sp. LJ34]|uniref:hypothetical protein n=1 Tax=Phytohabitans sp. LJ34 TaxID=3452217 RepID=UPI003F89E71A